MVGGEEEVFLPHEDLGRTAEHQRMVALTEFGEEYANRLGLKALKRPRDLARLVAELLCCGLYSLPRCRRDGAAGRVVQHEGDGCWTQVQVFGQRFKADTARAPRWRRRLSWHTCPVSHQSSR